MRRFIWAGACSLALSAMLVIGAPAMAIGLDPAFHQALIGPQQAKGVVVWSHGRSIDSEDWKSPTPPFLRLLRDSGWDVLRFDRLRADDTLNRSSSRLASIAGQLKHQGYRRIVLAGQSFGAFLALMAADVSSDVDAVVATAPAAFGDFEDCYATWRQNATRLYPLLERINRARVMLFFFHGDDFDPGGRGEQSRAILARRGPGFAVVDQPAYLTGHWVSSSGLFLRRYGDCVRDFVDDNALKGEFGCQPAWGETPSADLRLPGDLFHRRAMAPTQLAAIGASVRDSATEPALDGNVAVRDTWYGFYPNGREVLVQIDAMHGSALTAIYAIGPGIDKDEPAEWDRRSGQIIGHELVFAQKGDSTLRFRPSYNGELGATWISPDGKITMDAKLRRIDPSSVPMRAAAR